MRPRPVPSLLTVYHALQGMSPKAYASLARLIVAAAYGDSLSRPSRTRRVSNIGKPVISIVGDDRPGA